MRRLMRQDKGEGEEQGREIKIGKGEFDGLDIEVG